MKFDLKLTTAISAALMAAACSNNEGDWTAQRDTAVCTDKAGNRVADSNCQQQRAHSGSSGAVAGAFAWYYLSRNSRVPYMGERAIGGSFAGVPGRAYAHAPASTAVTRSAAISRGGFGSSARSFGGFGE